MAACGARAAADNAGGRTPGRRRLGLEPMEQHLPMIRMELAWRCAQHCGAFANSRSLEKILICIKVSELKGQNIIIEKKIFDEQVILVSMRQ
jgi:hypothetical protein